MFDNNTSSSTFLTISVHDRLSYLSWKCSLDLHSSLMFWAMMVGYYNYIVAEHSYSKEMQVNINIKGITSHL